MILIGSLLQAACGTFPQAVFLFPVIPPDVPKCSKMFRFWLLMSAQITNPHLEFCSYWQNRRV
jgi:hypothetical protein